MVCGRKVEELVSGKKEVKEEVLVDTVQRDCSDTIWCKESTSECMEMSILTVDAKIMSNAAFKHSVCFEDKHVGNKTKGCWNCGCFASEAL